MRLAGKVVLVTGASRGLGAAVAEACAAEGADLVLVARTRGGLEEVDDRVRARGRAATLVALDLRRGELVDKLGAAVVERRGRLDGWVHAAAELGTLTPVAHLDPKVLERLLDLMVVGTQRLIRALDLPLRAAPAGRAVLLTDREAAPGRAYWGGYAAAKAGMATLARAWAAETRLTPLRVHLVDPGPMRTRLRAAAYPGLDPATAPEPTEAARRIVDLLAAENAPAAMLGQPPSA